MESTLRVRDWMSEEPMTVAPDSLLVDAFAAMGAAGVRHLLVMDGRRLVGVLSNRDLYRRIPSHPEDRQRVVDALYRVPVRDVMTKPPLHTVEPDRELADAAVILLEAGVSALPVVTRGGRVLGILTTDDLLEALLEERRHAAVAAVGEPGG